jgi:polyisoprenoid-binding protein YceI
MTTTTDSLVRTVDGRTIPVPGSYRLDPSHTRADFEARHLMVTKVRGGFADVSGTIDVDEDPTRSTVSVTIPTATISSGTADRDAHLRSADFLDVEQHPAMTFQSTSITPTESAWRMQGNLTVRATTRPVTLDVEFVGVATDPWGNQRIAFTAAGTIDREDWDLTWNVPLEGDGVLVSRKIGIAIEAQAMPA